MRMFLPAPKAWQMVEVTASELYAWDDDSTYIRETAFL